MKRRSPIIPATDAQAADVAEHSAPFLDRCGVGAQRTLRLVHAGRLNQVYCVREGRRRWALKWYGPGPRAGARLRTERAFYELTWARGCRQVPEPLAWDEARRLALLGWMEGQPLAGTDITPSVLAELLAFLTTVNRARSAAAGMGFPMAGGAQFSVEDRIEAVERGVEAVTRRLAGPAAGQTLAGRLEPAWQIVRAAALRHGARARVDERRRLPLAERCLAAPEMGFSQTLRLVEGRLVFWNFDEAGWEDPAWWLAGVFSDLEAAPSLEYWDAFVPNAARLLGWPTDTAARAALWLPVRRFWRVCQLADSAGQPARPGDSRRRLARAGQWLRQVADPAWWRLAG